MIADDDVVVASLLCASLDRHFEIVGVAADSEAAIALAGTSRPDAALIDVEMPKGGALRAVPGILEVAPDVAIVVLSGNKFETIARKLINAGALAYCRKGVDPDELADLLIGSIETRASERARSAPRATGSR
jgi:DNA-binding NarL/FixJ family response regulator